ncbi:MAG TPA: orotate phosphoribosyltransferase [Rhizomicrobium sp.]|jgi:orotate phosphoribosyltransferase|nr:orotate phosphoribosyltransferase [Rhizomicrobium sp.]
MTTSPATRSAEEQELFELVRRRSFRRGHFILSSGRESEMYFNLKPTMLDPRGAWLCASAFLKIIAAEKILFAGGLEMGAVPMLGSLAALSDMQGHPVRTFFVRKTPKSHGTKELIEGLAPDETLSGARVMIVDDVATTGNSALIAAGVAREAGAIVDRALVIVDRKEGAREMLAPEGIRLLSILRGPEFLE